MTAYLGVGYIIGPELGALNFAGGLLAWGLFVPLLVYFVGPTLIDQYLALNNGNEAAAWGGIVAHLYRFIVRPIAVGTQTTSVPGALRSDSRMVTRPGRSTSKRCTLR